MEYYGAFHDDAHLYIVMEHCGGGDLLEKLLRDKKAMNERKVAVEVAYPCLAILKKMHEMRIIHRWGGALSQQWSDRWGQIGSLRVPQRADVAAAGHLQGHQAGEHLHRRPRQGEAGEAKAPVGVCSHTGWVCDSRPGVPPAALCRATLG